MRVRNRFRATGCLVAILLAVAGCSGAPGENAVDEADNGAGAGNLAVMDAVPEGSLPREATGLPMKEIMAHVFQFSGEAIWKWQGYITDEKGERSLFPTNDEEWEQAESASLTLAELTNVLLLPGRKVDDPRWDKAVADVRAVALALAKAAERRDQEAFFAAGGDLDSACESCHLAFAPWSAKPGVREVSGQAGNGS